MVEGGELDKAEKYLEIQRKENVYGVCDEGDLELGEDYGPRITVNNCLKRIGGKAITYQCDFFMRNRALPLERQIKYVEDMIVTRDTVKLGISRKEAIQTIA